MQGVHQGSKPAISVFGASNIEGISRQYARRPPRQVLRYLARDVHRVAIGDSRLIDVNDTSITFRMKDDRDRGRNKVMTLDGDEFLRRFLQHIPPRGFVRIRSSGFLANTVKRDRLAAIRQALGIAAASTPPTKAPPSPCSIAAPPWCNGSKCCRACRLNPCSGGPTPHETPTQSRQASPLSPTWGRGPVAAASPPPPTATQDAFTSPSATAKAAVFRGRFRLESP